MANSFLHPYPIPLQEEIEKAATDVPDAMLNAVNPQPLNGLPAHHRRVFFLSLFQALIGKGHSKPEAHWAIFWCIDQEYLTTETAAPTVFGCIRQDSAWFEPRPFPRGPTKQVSGTTSEQLPLERLLVVSTDALWDYRNVNAQRRTKTNNKTSASHRNLPPKPPKNPLVQKLILRRRNPKNKNKTIREIAMGLVEDDEKKAKSIEAQARRYYSAMKAYKSSEHSGEQS